MKAHDLVDEIFVPPRVTEPGQWRRYPSKREEFEVDASDGVLLRGSERTSLFDIRAGNLVPYLSGMPRYWAVMASCRAPLCLEIPARA